MFVPLMFGDVFLKSWHLPCIRRVYPHVVLQVVYPLLSVLVAGCGHCQVVQPVLVSATAAAVIIILIRYTHTYLIVLLFLGFGILSFFVYLRKRSRRTFPGYCPQAPNLCI